MFQLLMVGVVFAAKINSKKGYGDLAWGTSDKDAKRMGYTLTKMTSNEDKDNLTKLYSAPVTAYKVTSKDKSVAELQFHFYMEKLFFVTETLKANNKTLEDRYGNFSKQNIYWDGEKYTDAIRNEDGSIASLSIIITTVKDDVRVTMYDWDVYKEISFEGQKLAQGVGKIKTSLSITDELQEMANKFVQDLTQGKASTAKPSCAFLSLSTDYKNSLVENYVTDALTEAVFNTGKIKIIERANVEALLEEQKFQASGLVNEATAKSIGMIAGVDYVCYGTLKDLGDSFTVNVRIVDVETGELCAISRTSVTKDEYLMKQPQSAVSVSKTASTGTTKSKNLATSSSQSSNRLNNAWKVTVYDDSFTNTQHYVFVINSSDERSLFVRYSKAENIANSRVIAGIHWTANNGYNYNNEGTYDVKGDNGETLTKRLQDVWECYLNASGTSKFLFVWDTKQGSRWLTEIIKNSNTVAVRRDGLSRRFQTAGLLDAMASYGITWEEIDATLANEEF